jgi:hypothetical protein
VPKKVEKASPKITKKIKKQKKPLKAVKKLELDAGEDHDSDWSEGSDSETEKTLIDEE